MSEYSFEISAQDTSCALDCEAKQADRDGLPNLAERQRATALHLRNAVHKMLQLCPEGYRVETRIVISHVPDVNAVLRDDVRENRA